MDGQPIDLAEFGFPGEVAHNLAPSYFEMMLGEPLARVIPGATKARMCVLHE
jgi:hypothetical protein